MEAVALQVGDWHGVEPAVVVAGGIRADWGLSLRENGMEPIAVGLEVADTGKRAGLRQEKKQDKKDQSDGERPVKNKERRQTGYRRKRLKPVHGCYSWVAFSRNLLFQNLVICVFMKNPHHHTHNLQPNREAENTLISGEMKMHVLARQNAELLHFHIKIYRLFV